MSRAFLLSLVLSGFAVAAPVPKETEAEKIKRLFGTPVDVEKDCKFNLDGEKLVIRTPEAGHSFAFGAGMGNAPRVARTVEGDFVATVRIRLAAPRAPQPTGGSRTFFQAGLFFGEGETNFAYNARAVEEQQNQIRRTGRHAAWVGGNQGWSASSGGGAFDPDATFLRVVRTGTTTKFGASADGKAWHEFKGPDVAYPDKISLGLFVANPGGLPFAAEFDQFTITTPTVIEKK